MRPLAAYSGPSHPKILLIGEAWGESEDQVKLPFAGAAGKELWRLLGEAFPAEPELHSAISAMHRYGLAWVKERESWLEAVGIGLTNVLNFRPPGNNLEALCGKKQEVGGDSYSWPPVAKGKYLRPEFLPELSRLEAEISQLQPNLLVALGNTACWALLRSTNIGSVRGAIAEGHPEGAAAGVKILPAYHPAAVLRNWAWRPILLADLMKARREGESREICRPKRRILANPTLPEVREFTAQVRIAAAVGKLPLLACDTETEARQITCISFAPTPDSALVVPFWDKTAPGWSYWSESEEIEVWELIRAMLEDPCVNIVGQNFIYDMQYLLPMKIRCHRATEDTMLLHHALFPELQKGLGFLGSIYSNEASWKLMRKWRPDSEKKDE